MEQAHPWRPAKHQTIIASVSTFLIGLGLIGGYFEAHGLALSGIAGKLDFWFLLPGYFVCMLLGGWPMFVPNGRTWGIWGLAIACAIRIVTQRVLRFCPKLRAVDHTTLAGLNRSLFLLQAKLGFGQ